jgi:hypothetical protein
VAGYTPIFDSVFQGSLCGKWPDIGIWALMLAMQDKNGEIDAHPSYIAMVTGCPVDQVEAAIARFCEPDPSSRTPDEDGRRLIPIPGRGFGWTVVNHRKYREKARKASFDAQRSADGRNAERMQERRADPRRPAQTRADPPSDSDADSKKKNLLGDGSPEWVEIRSAYPKRKGDHRWPKALVYAGARLREGHSWAEMLAGVKRYAAFVRAEGKEHTPYVKQAATFFSEKAFLEPWSAPKGDRFANAV